MARTKRGVVSRAKHKKILKSVKGQYGSCLLYTSDAADE